MAIGDVSWGHRWRRPKALDWRRAEGANQERENGTRGASRTPIRGPFPRSRDYRTRYVVTTFFAASWSLPSPVTRQVPDWTVAATKRAS